MIHVVFNSPYLGGAERSVIEQATMSFSLDHLHFHIPRTQYPMIESDIYKFLKSNHNKCHISEFPFQSQLFQVSRTHIFSQLIGLFFIPVAVFKIILYRKKMKLKSDDILWLNGNKAAILFLMSLIFDKTPARFVWHWRDYPSTSGLLSLVKILLKKINPSQILLLANSQSVEDSLKLWRPNNQIETSYVYNPTGDISHKHVDKVETIGLASMLAPWKGQHDILLNLALNKENLLSIGVKQCFIFGDEIYQTSGEHSGYKEQLEKLIEKFALKNFVYLKGNESPKKIFQDIDLLIHSSLKPEPFGRILIESFSAGIPVLSTALGGSREVMGYDFERGWNYQISHPNDFFTQIKCISESLGSTLKIQNAKEWSLLVNKQIPLKFRELFKN